MANSLSKSFHEMNSVLGLCPCCGELFRLPEAGPYLKGKKVETIIDKLYAELRRVERSEERLDVMEEELRAKARTKGQAAAKRKLRKIDPVFSGVGIDPQDVKVIFDPVEFVVFDGLNAGEVKQVKFMGHHPTSKAQEKVQQSLVSAIDAGNLDFKTLRVNGDGQVTS